MYRPSKKTLYIAAAFASAAAIGTYAYWEDISFAVCDLAFPEQNAGEARLADDQGTRYTLLNNGDGTETALYDDERSVTFRREDSGSLVWEAGTASLIPAIAAGYYAFHGFAAPSGRMDAPTMTYRVTTPLLPYVPPYRAGRSGWSHVGTGGGARSTPNYENKKSSRANFVGRKSGFGGAGARSGGS